MCLHIKNNLIPNYNLFKAHPFVRLTIKAIGKKSVVNLFTGQGQS